MRKSVLITGLAFALLLAGCAEKDNGPESGSAGAENRFGPPEKPVTVEGSVTTVRMTGNDRMQYSLNAFEVKTGTTVKLVFQNVGKMPKEAMGHNVVFLEQGRNAVEFAVAGAKAKDTEYVPPEYLDWVIAGTRMLGPGETQTIEFTAPAPGLYPYVCTFPAHALAGMKGVMTVAE